MKAKKPAKPRKPRKRKCKVCKGWFLPFNTFQQCCAVPKCALAWAKVLKQKKEDKIFKERKEKLKTPAKWKKETQDEFNKFIRLRDWDQPCISCGRTEVEWTRGGEWDCGHYISVGSHNELRFVETNAHKQCKSCNGGSGKYTRKNHTVTKEYRERLIIRIGEDEVEWLEGPHDQIKYTIDMLKEIKQIYKMKVKELIALEAIRD